MAIALSKLLANLGQAVQQAQAQLEENAVQRFCSHFSCGEGPQARMLAPRTHLFTLPDGAGGTRTVEAPDAALLPHNSLQLDSVHIRLNVTPSLDGEGEDVYVEVGPSGERADASYSQLELTFQTSPASEGIARVNQSALQTI